MLSFFLLFILRFLKCFNRLFFRFILTKFDCFNKMYYVYVNIWIFKDIYIILLSLFFSHNININIYGFFIYWKAVIIFEGPWFRKVWKPLASRIANEQFCAQFQTTAQQHSFHLLWLIAGLSWTLVCAFKKSGGCPEACGRRVVERMNLWFNSWGCRKHKMLFLRQKEAAARLRQSREWR